MTIPKFLLGDNSEFQDAIFVIHTAFPRFIIDLTKDEIEWLEEFDSQDKDELATETENAIKEATAWYDAEIAKYDED
ncbi:hypothetical protein EAX61_07170 [Dokdonia sinensis]|uniref:Uncharacterized protein n=1 Tax=Dokdonia sinensis TaxID=2479847 RepID=A0A3M0G6S3_9FLAO|nr:hypothetical protein [Dokdonia sinensis]RMB60594.1 hypothetical protein EAX61_07170 [Dokdonia sinensis]